MGRDKALLPIGQIPLVVHVAQIVAQACGSATLVGSRELYGSLGWPLVEDNPRGNGPLGGLIAALSASTAEWNLPEWNLVVACDMPWLEAGMLRTLAERRSSAAAIVARSDRGIEPLCALYHRRCLPVFHVALEQGERAVWRVLQRLEVEEWAIPDSRLLYNANTPAEWALVEAGG
jgi:molybdopterin-guanine dinucleotide biosynthesis protein A